MPNILTYFRWGERSYSQTHCHTLFQLSKVFAVQDVIEFGLPNQDDLEQLLIGFFEVPEQPDFFQNLRA